MRSCQDYSALFFCAYTVQQCSAFFYLFSLSDNPILCISLSHYLSLYKSVLRVGSRSFLPSSNEIYAVKFCVKVAYLISCLTVLKKRVRMLTPALIGYGYLKSSSQAEKSTELDRRLFWWMCSVLFLTSLGKWLTGLENDPLSVDCL